jgi:hypothetical protein
MEVALEETKRLIHDGHAAILKAALPWRPIGTPWISVVRDMEGMWWGNYGKLEVGLQTEFNYSTMRLRPQ